MNSYCLHFLIAEIVGLIVILFLKKRFCLRHLIFYLIGTSVVSYLLFFNYNLGLIKSWLIYLIGYIGVLCINISCVFINSFSWRSVEQKRHSVVVKVVGCFLAELILVMFFFVIPWAVDTFSLSNAEAVLFTLFSPTTGSYDFVFETLTIKVFLYSGVSFGVIVILQLLIAWRLLRLNISGVFYKNLFFIPESKFLGQKLLPVCLLTVLFFFVTILVNMIVVPSVFHSPAFEAYFGKTVYSSFYEDFYEQPEKVKFPNDQIQKNLVVIFLESMMNNFESYTPEITAMRNKGVDFWPGAETVSGTGWTIAGMTSALCGLPLNMPITEGEYLGSLPTYLPNAICVMDLLANQRYNQIFIQGSSGDFTQKRAFWNRHGNVIVHDLEYFRHVKKIPENYRVFWGIEDKKIYEYAKEELDSISKNEGAFAFYMLTIDTHQPEGFLDNSCAKELNSEYGNVLRCASRMLSDFMTWAQKQAWFSKTVFWIVGDHTSQILASNFGLPQNEKLLATAFCLNCNRGGFVENRNFSNLDYAPSILESLGWSLPKHGFGLGRSLFSNNQTALEKYGKDSLDVLLRQRSYQYNYFLFGK